MRFKRLRSGFRNCGTSINSILTIPFFFNGSFYFTGQLLRMSDWIPNSKGKNLFFSPTFIFKY